jgi:hypothetical protein
MKDAYPYPVSHVITIARSRTYSSGQYHALSCRASGGASWEVLYMTRAVRSALPLAALLGLTLMAFSATTAPFLGAARSALPRRAFIAAPGEGGGRLSTRVGGEMVSASLCAEDLVWAGITTVSEPPVRRSP